jgi:hypothetical protein
MEIAPKNLVSRLPREYRFLTSAQAMRIAPQSVGPGSVGVCALGMPR